VSDFMGVTKDSYGLPKDEGRFLMICAEFVGS
jgi:hypothetical protein